MDFRPDVSSTPSPTVHNYDQQTLHEARVPMEGHRGARTLVPTHPLVVPCARGQAGHYAPCGCRMEGRDFWNRAHLLGRNAVHSLGLLWLPFLPRGLLLAFPTHLQDRKGIFGNHMKGRRDERNSTGQLLLEVTDLQTGRLVFPV